MVLTPLSSSSAENKSSSRYSRRASKASARRRGSILVLSAFLMVFLLGMVAFAVDLGYIVNVRTDAQRAVDAAALAGAGELVNGTPASQAEVLNYLGLNSVGGRTLTTGNTTIEFGQWSSTNSSFIAGGALPSAVRVSAVATQYPLFFGAVFGQTAFQTQAKAIATYQPRDIMIVLDFSASMNDDSELASIGGALTKASIEANLLQIYSEMGLPQYGNLGNSLTSISSTSTSTIKTNLGLNNVAYPFASGSWNDYIKYVKSNITSNYRKKYGKITLVDYWLSQYPSYAQTNKLWMGSAQPVTAVKDAVKLFLAYLQSVNTDDRVGLVVYTSSDQTAIIEQGLTNNMTTVSTICTQRQAGHYTGSTNIGDGIKKGREELVANARVGASKLIVLMTDGQANLPGSGNNPDTYAVSQATQCGAAKIPIVAVSLGAGADTSIMQQIANATSGVHFNIPGGQTVAQYKAQLESVFQQVAKDRPLKLVQ